MAERLSAHYRFSGAALDVDALLSIARPKATHEVWRRGEPIADGHVTRTAGVQIEIGDFDDPADAVEAIDAFLDAEPHFLTAVQEIATDEMLSVISVALWVEDDEPVEFALPAELMARLAGTGVALTVTGYPTGAEE